MLSRLRLLVYLYGDIEAGFRYEERRNRCFVDAGATHRSGTSVFQFTDPSVRFQSGRPARCTLVAFVDDHFSMERPKAPLRLSAILESKTIIRPRFEL